MIENLGAILSGQSESDTVKSNEDLATMPDNIADCYLPGSNRQKWYMSWESGEKKRKKPTIGRFIEMCTHW